MRLALNQPNPTENMAAHRKAAAMQHSRAVWVIALAAALLIVVSIGCSAPPPDGGGAPDGTNDNGSTDGDDTSTNENGAGGGGDEPELTLGELLGVSDDDVDPEVVAEAERLLSHLDDFDGQLRELVTEQGEEAAKTEIVQRLSDDPEVEWAVATAQGVSLLYTNGLRAAMTLNPQDIEADAEVATTALKAISELKPPRTGTAKARLGSDKTVFLCPAYWERYPFADEIIQAANARFDACGLDRFVVYKDAECTVARFLQLSGYGVVHIYSHGIPHPSETDPQKSFLMTGDVATPAVIGILKLVGLYPDKIMFHKTDFGSVGNIQTMIAISPDFLRGGDLLYGTDQNNFTQSRSLLFLGFCYSAAGSWLDEMTEQAGALAVVGFDQFLTTTQNMDWALSMYTDLGDTTRRNPLELSQWYDNIDTNKENLLGLGRGADGENDYLLVEVNMEYAGSADTVLWDHAGTFADPCLEAAVRADIGKDTGDLTEADLARVTRFTARNRGILYLDGIENCPNIEYLDVGSNEIVDLTPLAGLTNVTGLVLDDNDISDLSPLAGLTSLETIDVGHNYISTLSDLSALTSLLYVKANWQKERNLSNLDGLDGLPLLNTLSVSGNSIDDLWPITGLTELRLVTLSWNQIENVEPLQGLAKITSLRLDENPISDIGPLGGSASLGNAPYITVTCCSINYNCDPTLGSTAQCDIMEDMEAAGADVVWGLRDQCGTIPPLTWPSEHEVCDY